MESTRKTKNIIPLGPIENRLIQFPFDSIHTLNKRVWMVHNVGNNLKSATVCILLKSSLKMFGSSKKNYLDERDRIEWNLPGCPRAKRALIWINTASSFKSHIFYVYVEQRIRNYWISQTFCSSSICGFGNSRKPQLGNFAVSLVTWS